MGWEQTDWGSDEKHVRNIGEYRVEVFPNGGKWCWYFERIVETGIGSASTKEDAMKAVMAAISQSSD